MLGFIKEMCIGLLSVCMAEVFDRSLGFHSKGFLKCLSLNN